MPRSRSRAALVAPASIAVAAALLLTATSAAANELTVTVSGTDIGIYPRESASFDAAHSAAAISDGTSVQPTCYRAGQDVTGSPNDSDIWVYVDALGFLPVAYLDVSADTVTAALPPCDEGVGQPIAPQQNVRRQYDRDAVVAYADANWDQPRRIVGAPDCTVYTSDALSQSLVKDATWTDTSTDVNQVASKVRSLWGRVPFPTKTYADANLLVRYLLDRGYATVTRIDLNQHLVPGADRGDVIAYAWDGASGDDLPPLDHLAVVVGDDGTQTKVDQHEDNAQWKGWNWSTHDNDWINHANPAAVAYLIHITY